MTTPIEFRDLLADDEFETRATQAEDGTRTLEGYAIRFNVWSEDLGWFKERIEPDAVDKTLRARNDVKALVNHDSSKVIGSTRAKTLTLEADTRGVLDAITLPDTTYANDLWVTVDRKDTRGQSFGFSVVADEWNEDYSERTVLELRLHEVSVVTFPAYSQTSVSARSLAMFEARSGRDRGELAAAIEALRTGAELTAEHADIISEAVQRSLGTTDDESAEIVTELDELRDADPDDVADKLFMRRARLRLRERTLQAL